MQSVPSSIILVLCVVGGIACGSTASSGIQKDDAGHDARRDPDTGVGSDASSEPDAGDGGCGVEPPIECVCPNTQARCIGGSWQCPLTCEDGSTGDSGSGCPAGQVLVVSTSCETSATCMGGSFQCAEGYTMVSGGPCCCQSTACAEIPAACDGTATCKCASSLCGAGSSCGQSLGAIPAGALSCGFFPG